jgi:nucleoside-diphosphate-sugar epimerase
MGPQIFLLNFATISERSFSTSVKRVVYTSSTAAIHRVATEPKIFSEKDWNEQSIDEIKELGRNASGVTKYRASKTLAEKGMFLDFEPAWY